MLASNNTHTSRRKAESYLQKERHGYWPYQSGGDASLETTAWCAIALRSDRTVAEETWQYFRTTQNPNGGWSTGVNDGASDWTSNLVVLALTIMCRQMDIDSEKRAFVDSSYSYLVKSRRQANIEFLRWIFRLLKLPSNFPSGRGWPFFPGTSMLVEPTVYAMMAIKSTASSKQEPLKSVVALAEEYLFNRYCTRGGWNYGENVRLTEQLPPYPVTTAQTIIALQDKANDERVQTSLKFLTDAARQDNTIMALAWSALARDCFNQDCRQELDMLAKHQNKDGSFGKSIFLTALSTCALQVEENNPLKFPAPPTVEVRLGKDE